MRLVSANAMPSIVHSLSSSEESAAELIALNARVATFAIAEMVFWIADCVEFGPTSAVAS